MYNSQVFANKETGALAIVTSNVPRPAQNRTDREYNVLLHIRGSMPTIIVVDSLERAHKLCHSHLTLQWKFNEIRVPPLQVQG